MNISENLNRLVVDLLLLSKLREKDMGAIQFSRELAEECKPLSSIKAVFWYYPLFRLLDKGYISKYKETDMRSCKQIYYHITPLGIEYLNKMAPEFLLLSRTIIDALHKFPYNSV